MLSGLVGALFKAIFFLILDIAKIIIYPITLLISTAFPFIGDIIGNIANFFSLIFTYVPTALHLLCIPQGVVAIFFDFLIAYYAFYIGGRVYIFAMNMYNRFKP